MGDPYSSAPVASDGSSRRRSRCTRGHTPARVIPLSALLAIAIMTAACGVSSRDSAFPLERTPTKALDRCLEVRFMRSICPRRVPLASGRPSALSAGCLDSRGSLVALTSESCRTALWSLMGAPSGPAPIGHVVISASLDAWQCTWPHELRAPSPNDRLLTLRGRRAVSFGQVRWYGQSGQLVLAPPYFAGGGPMGDHLAFCFHKDGVDYAITIHSWRPFAQVVATLKSLVGSTLQR